MLILSWHAYLCNNIWIGFFDIMTHTCFNSDTGRGKYHKEKAINICQEEKGLYTSFFYNTVICLQNKLCCYGWLYLHLYSFMCKVLYQLHKWVQKSECTKCEIFFNANSIFLFKWVLLVSVINKFQWDERFGTLQ